MTNLCNDLHHSVLYIGQTNSTEDILKQIRDYINMI